MGKDRIEWVDYAKAISIILVVFHHSVFKELDSVFYHDALNTFDNMLNRVRMPLFFFIAGLFIHKALTSHISYFLKSKIYHFSYLFVLWAMISFLFKDLAPYIVKGVYDGPKDIMSFLVVDPPVWFIYALLIFFAVTRLARSYLPVVLCITVILYTLSAQSDEYIFLDKLVRFYPFFLMGYMINDVVKKLATRVNYHLLLFMPLYFWAVITLSEWSNTPLGIFILSLGGIASGIIIAVLLTRSSAFSWLGYVGKNTLPIYVAHTIPVGVLREILPYVIPGQVALATIILVVSGVGLPLLASIISKKIGMGWLFDTSFLKKDNIQKQASGLEKTTIQ